MHHEKKCQEEKIKAVIFICSTIFAVQYLQYNICSTIFAVQYSQYSDRKNKGFLAESGVKYSLFCMLYAVQCVVHSLHYYFLCI